MRCTTQCFWHKFYGFDYVLRIQLLINDPKLGSLVLYLIQCSSLLCDFPDCQIQLYTV